MESQNSRALEDVCKEEIVDSKFKLVELKMNSFVTAMNERKERKVLGGIPASPCCIPTVDPGIGESCTC